MQLNSICRLELRSEIGLRAKIWTVNNPRTKAVQVNGITPKRNFLLKAESFFFFYSRTKSHGARTHLLKQCDGHPSVRTLADTPSLLARVLFRIRSHTHTQSLSLSLSLSLSPRRERWHTNRERKRRRKTNTHSGLIIARLTGRAL